MEYYTAVKNELIKTTLINMDESHKMLNERKGKEGAGCRRIHI